MKACEKCPLFPQKEKYFVPAESPPGATWMVIGEAPGENEARDKVPFSPNGKAGAKLRELIDGVGPDRPYITNAVKCWPGPGNPTPSPKAINQCREAYLDDEISSFSGDRIVLLGGSAAHALLRKKRRISELLGHPFQILGKWVLAVWHPAAYFYSGNRQFLLDIRRAIQWGMRQQ